MAPGLAPLMPMFEAGKMAALLNVGTLVQPTTKAQYTSRSVPLPPKLFSHNDQQSFWQASSPEGAQSGWGGRMGDLFASGNGNSTFTCISVSGNTVYLSGNNASAVPGHAQWLGAGAGHQEPAVWLGGLLYSVAKPDDRAACPCVRI